MSATLDDSEIPEEILLGCKAPMPGVVRGIVVCVIAAVVFGITAWLKGRVASRVQAPVLIDVVWLATLAACAYQFGKPLWLYLEEHMRDCSTYRKFKRYFAEEMLKRGMTKELAIGEAMESIERDRRMRSRMRVSTGERRYVNDGASFSVSF